MSTWCFVVVFLVCCCHRKSCATHALIQNIFAFIFACILIVINSLFIRWPNQCFFTDGICQRLSWIRYLFDSIECLIDGLAQHCGHTRLTLLIAQLIAGILLAVTCLIYLIVYVYVVRRLSHIDHRIHSSIHTDDILSIYASNKQHLSKTSSSSSYRIFMPMPISIRPLQVSALLLHDYHMSCMTPKQYSTIHVNDCYRIRSIFNDWVDRVMFQFDLHRSRQ
jgi:hypothetical protein